MLVRGDDGGGDVPRRHSRQVRRRRTTIWTPDISVSETNASASVEMAVCSRAFGANYIWLPDQAGHKFRIGAQLTLHLPGMTVSCSCATLHTNNLKSAAAPRCIMPFKDGLCGLIPTAGSIVSKGVAVRGAATRRFHRIGSVHISLSSLRRQGPSRLLSGRNSQLPSTRATGSRSCRSCGKPGRQPGNGDRALQHHRGLP